MAAQGRAEPIEGFRADRRGGVAQQPVDGVGADARILGDPVCGSLAVGALIGAGELNKVVADDHDRKLLVSGVIDLPGMPNACICHLCGIVGGGALRQQPPP